VRALRDARGSPSVDSRDDRSTTAQLGSDCALIPGPASALIDTGGHWPRTAREIARAINGLSEDPRESVMLLADIRRVFADRGVDRLETKALINALCADEDRPWQDYRDQGCTFTDKQMAALLRLLDVRPGTIRIGEKTPKGYMRSWFEDAFDRYLPAAATAATTRPINSLAEGRGATSRATPTATRRQPPQITSTSVAAPPKPASATHPLSRQGFDLFDEGTRSTLLG
jgi:hypothetical protein